MMKWLATPKLFQLDVGTRLILSIIFFNIPCVYLISSWLRAIYLVTSSPVCKLKTSLKLSNFNVHHRYTNLLLIL